MKTVVRRDEMRGFSRQWGSEGLRVGLVPTMGNLHAGHLVLVETLAPLVDRLVVSIFVNPLQFGAGEDYESYPRTVDADREALAALPVDAVFAPSAAEMYPHGEPATVIDVPALTGTLCGAVRPGHFAGVALVVTKLFHLVEPDVAAFGAKDYQQLQVVRRLVDDLDLPVEIVAVPTVREADGLAMSSRNQYLTPEARSRAPSLHETLRGLAAALRAGRADYADLEREAAVRLRETGFDEVDYVAIRRTDDLAPPRGREPRLVCLAAARLGAARLIDNLEVDLNP